MAINASSGNFKLPPLIFDSLIEIAQANTDIAKRLIDMPTLAEQNINNFNNAIQRNSEIKEGIQKNMSNASIEQAGFFVDGKF